MKFISIWLGFCNPNSKSMAWRKVHEAMNSDPWLLLTDLWPSALDPWPLTHEQPTLSHEPWALAMVHELLALTKMIQSCQNRTSSWTILDFLQMSKLSKTYGHVFATQILDYITWTLSLALIPEPWWWSMSPDPCPKSCNYTKIAWIDVVIMNFHRKKHWINAEPLDSI